MNKAQERSLVREAIIEKLWSLGVDPAKTQCIFPVNVLYILKNEDPESLPAQFYRRASDNQWKLLEREFRVWQRNEPACRVLRQTVEKGE